MYCIYILKSKITDKYYIGQTQSIKNRLEEHNKKKVRSIKCNAPFDLVYLKKFKTRAEAIKREAEIKRKKSRKYIENLIIKQTKECADSSMDRATAF